MSASFPLIYLVTDEGLRVPDSWTCEGELWVARWDLGVPPSGSLTYRTVDSWGGQHTVRLEADGYCTAVIEQRVKVL